MNDNFNPNENTQNSTPNSTPSNPPQEDTRGQVWSVPPQEGQSYRPPYYESTHTTPTPPPQQTPPAYNGTSGGWQQPSNTPSPQKESYQWNFADYEQAQALKPPKKKKGLLVFSIVMASVVMISLISFAGVGIAGMISKNNDPVTDPPGIEVPLNDLNGLALQDKPQEAEVVLPEGKLTTEQVVEKVEPSIVAITTYISGQSLQPEGMGSGIIMREDGYVVTNAHVVDGARGITVTLSDGETQYEGRVVGIDTQTDLAVVKVDATGLVAADFGNSDQVKVGEKVIAIGNPQSLDFAGSVTQGIVSGLNRSLVAGGNGSSVTSYSSMIQTDAAINPGNSGGALVNEYGQVIGINSAKVASGSEGMGFAIPSSQAKPIIDDLMNYGRVTGRVLLGVTVYSIDEVSARLNGVPTGLLIQTTVDGSDISKKGVVPGDIITKVNDKEITSQQVLTEEMKGKKPGDTVELELYRRGSTSNQKGRFFTVNVALMEDTNSSVPNTAESTDPGMQPPADGQMPGYDDSYGSDMEDFFNYFFN